MSSSSLLSAFQEASSSFNEIPIIDFKDATSTDPVVRRKIANEIRDACLRVGFFYVKNHGIPQSAIEGAVQAAKDYFNLPLETKMKMDIRNSTNYKGYTALLAENTDPLGNGDMHEGFELGFEEFDVSETEAPREDGAMTGKNVWPENMPGFREVVLEYYHAAVRLGLSMFPLFALALDLPENFFADKTTNPAAIMRLLHYPPQTGPVDERVIGIGAHTE